MSALPHPMDVGSAAVEVAGPVVGRPAWVEGCERVGRTLLIAGLALLVPGEAANIAADIGSRDRSV